MWFVLVVVGRALKRMFNDEISFFLWMTYAVIILTVFGV